MIFANLYENRFDRVILVAKVYINTLYRLEWK